MKKRLLACLLVLSLFATGLGFAPAAQAAEDGIAAQWTTKENLAPADREIVLQPDEGRFPRMTAVGFPTRAFCIKTATL